MLTITSCEGLRISSPKLFGKASKHLSLAFVHYARRLEPNGLRLNRFARSNGLEEPSCVYLWAVAPSPNLGADQGLVQESFHPGELCNEPNPLVVMLVLGTRENIDKVCINMYQLTGFHSIVQ